MLADFFVDNLWKWAYSRLDSGLLGFCFLKAGDVMGMAYQFYTEMDISVQAVVSSLGLFWPYCFCFEIIYLAWTICQASWWGLDPRYYFCSFDFILSICISFPFSLISTRHQRLSVLRRSYASCLTSTFQPIQGDKDQYKVGIRWKNDRSSTSCSQPCAGAWYLQSTY